MPEHRKIQWPRWDSNQPENWLLLNTLFSRLNAGPPIKAGSKGQILSKRTRLLVIGGRFRRLFEVPFSFETEPLCN